ncbi:pre-rRNA-processing protein esf1 [Chytriomyces hyalinus]|nr:pre-rRNA-processing protein esf1 [Chytriomyces hyalinus]
MHFSALCLGSQSQCPKASLTGICFIGLETLYCKLLQFKGHISPNVRACKTMVHVHSAFSRVDGTFPNVSFFFSQTKKKPTPREMDSRFASLGKNPRFLKPKKKDSKVSIDKRFSAIFNEASPSSANVKAAKTDKYGRKLKKTVATDLKRFYKIEDEEEDNEEKGADDRDVEKGVEKEEDEESEASFEGGIHSRDTESDGFESVSDEEGPSGSALIRGEGLAESSDEDESDLDQEALEELDRQVQSDEDEPEVENLGPISRRFAAVNMDWDNIKSRDLYKVFDAFRPKSGALISVSIYKSEFGKERLEREAREGPPKEIFGSKKLGGREEQQSLFGEEEGKDFDDEKLRQYQLDRLRYYYAVAECDSAATASAIHTAVDGTEFEKSANTFNLQFIPDDMTFDDKPVDTATSAAENYQPAAFSTAALQHSKAQLTWDLDDPDRMRITRKRFSKDELKEMDFKAYLASESEESSGDEAELQQRALKYKSLVSGADEEDGAGSDKNGSDDEVVGDMEITFVPGLSENAAAKMKKLNKEKEAEEDNVFMQERRKRKEKAKEKKSLKDDDFFNDGDDKDEPATTATKLTSKKASTKKQTEKELAELELVMFDETNAAEGKHFDMKDILKAEKQTGKKKKLTKKGKKAELVQVQDDFDINVKDSRFAEMHSSHHFAIDPTNPNFKKTAAMSKLLDERKKVSVKSSAEPKEPKVSAEVSDKLDLKAMVDSIKRKSAAAAAAQTQGKRQKVGK